MKIQEEEARKGKGNKCHTSRPWELTIDGIGLIEGWPHRGFQVHQWHWGESATRRTSPVALHQLVMAIGRPTNFRR